MSDPRLVRLRQIADLVLEQRSERLAGAGAARAAVRARLAALDQWPDETERADTGLQISWYRFETWATPRRLELQRQAALCEAEWLNALGEARRAFARVQLLRQLKERK
ncbi:hypothetical protein [Pseudogemmobacter faecipullorum]|uniref:Uncharacterized protein n=1 Tax=Pseudogemmobacter faecipullorum TaxID=2755041 RepID=A0ABS8CJK5_9RHOB|nr:hypothetical protein [Pseudogemmobacter faecipullorum]MCB5409566.1 hypothetical protein [Pseudogemmobacter faecipullorum]